MRDALIDRVASHVAGRALIPPGAPVLALVSGGADSMCLLHALTRFHDGRVGVLSFDHGLRPESADEAGAVVAEARRLGCDGWVEPLAVAPGPGVQARARDARRAAARRVARTHGFDLIATGHTASDQAETVLFRLARGTGRTGAIGMAASGAVVRPMLVVTRDETREWCRRNGVMFVDDPSNTDPAHARTRVRHDLLPALRAVHPGAELAVARYAELVDDEAAVLAPLVDAAWRRCLRDDGIDVAALAREAVAMRRLVVRRLLSGAGVACDRVWVERSLELAATGAAGFDAPGAHVHVWRGILRVAAGVTAPSPAVLGVPGDVVFGGARLAARPAVARAPVARRVDVLVEGPFEVRSPAPGDRIALAGGGRQGVGRLLAAAGVPADRRPLVPVVAMGERVVWVSGYRADVTLVAPPGASATRLELL